MIFISYRRRDSAAVSGRLQVALRQAFADVDVFLDSASIVPGQRWQDRLRQRLAEAEVVLVVIGPEWIRAADEWGQRLIDKVDDWVRQEIETALSSGKIVMPLLVNGARIPPADRLPATVAPLTQRQAVELRDDYFDHDVQLVVSSIRSFNAGSRLAGHDRATDEPGPYPAPPPETPDPLDDEKIRIALGGTLRHWRVMESALPERPTAVRVELYREFKFRTFRDAISFMYEVAPGCDIAIHHPRWENIWRTVRVFLTTWDIGHRISDRDVQLAKYFDRAYSEFPGADLPN